jgi:hypothetical protein
VLMLFGIHKEVVKRESYCSVITKPILLANRCEYKVLLTSSSICWSMAQVICKVRIVIGSSLKMAPRPLPHALFLASDLGGYILRAAQP